MEGEPFVLRSDAEGVATLTLNRGDRLNPLSTEMLSALGVAIGQVADDRSVRVVVIAGAGRHFCAGHDLAEMRAHPDSAWQSALFDLCTRVMMALPRLPQPVIARVHGAAVAAGCQLVSMCDLAVAADSARFALPGVKSGLFCTTPGVAVSRDISKKHALELLLTGDVVDAATAERWGLVNRAVPLERLDTEVSALAGRIASLSGPVVSFGKRLFYEQVEKSIAEAYAVAGGGMVCNMSMDDAVEGIDAFLGKRRPLWRG